MRKILVAAMLTLAFTACSKKNTEVKGTVFNTISRDNVKTADPTNANDEVSTDVLGQIYDMLYQYDYFADQLKLIPSQAEAMPEVSKDKLTYTIKIKKGLRFQDEPCFAEGKGREIVAEDYIYAWKRHANPANFSQAYWIWDGKILGMAEFKEKFSKGRPAEEVMAEPLEGMKALDSHTIQIKLIKPYPQLLYVLAMHFSTPVPKEAIQKYGKDFANHPVANGPFKVQSWAPTSEVILVRNENFREELFPAADKLGQSYKHLAKYSGKRLPLVDAIRFSIIKEEQPRWLGFLSGKYDQSKIWKDNFDSAIKPDKISVTDELAKKGITVSIEPSLIFWYVSINMKDKLLGSNKYLRQAIASALDREGWLKTFKNGRGYVQDEVNPKPIIDHCNSIYRWTFDLKRAKELLAKAGYPDGKGLPVFRYDTRNNDLSERQLAEFIQKNLAQVGIQIDVTTNTFPAYLDKMNRGNLQLSKGGWNMDYPDAENTMGLLYGPNSSPGPNEANFQNAAYDKLFEKMAVMTPSPERRKIICEMEKIIQEEAPWAYGIFENEYRVINPWLKGYHTSETIQTKYKYLAVEK